MNTAERKLFLSKLEKDSDEELLKTLNYFRNNSDMDLLGNVLDLLSKPKSQAIHDAVIQLCLDIKTADAAYTLFDYIMEAQDDHTRRLLLSVIWQIGQDFSLRAAHIVEMILNETDFQTAFDCLTLLENSTDNIPADTAQQLLQKIEQEQGRCHSSIIPLLDSAREHLANTITDAE